MNRSPRHGTTTSDPILAHPVVVLIAWAAFFLVLTPTALQYTHSINYSSEGSGLAGSESERAQDLLASVFPSHSTLVVAVERDGRSPAQLQNATLAFQASLAPARIGDYNSSESVYSAYAGYLDGIFGPQLPQTRALLGSTANLTAAVDQFPARLLGTWEGMGGTASTLNASYQAAGGSSSGYEPALLGWLAGHDSGPSEPAALVRQAVAATAPAFFPASPALNLTLAIPDVSGYSSAVPGIVAQLLSSPGHPIPELWVEAASEPGDLGTNVVALGGLEGLPAFLSSQFVSPNGALSLVLVVFSVSESFREADGTYPAQAATPLVRGLAAAQFGSDATVTGSGALAYDTQQVESGSGALFALTFVFLGVAVALTLRSWVAPILALVLVSLSTVVGYLAIELTGLWVGKVDFVVTYTLMAVTLGVATDYALFFLYRYREELTRGETPEAALATATRSARFAILVSAATVAVGLGTLSFLNGLSTWGPVLFLTILAVGAIEVTLLPALARLIGPRLFVRRWLAPAAPTERSVFYRAAARSGARPTLILAMAAVIAVPAVAGFLFAPTSYNFSGGVPAGVSSAQGQSLIEQQFGANLLYPTYVIVTSPTAFLAPNGSLTLQGAKVLPAVAADLLGRSGVSSVQGPFVSGTTLESPANGSADGAASYSLEGGRAVYYVVYSQYGPYSAGAINMVESLRANSSYTVGGITSAVVDESQLDNVQFPVLEVLLTVFIAIILGLAFRSVTIPLISVAGVFLSISSTTGLLYLISTYLLHAQFLWLIPLILFVILMSLGNDYTVFLLTRIREEQTRFGPEEGIRRGIAGSGVVVSALGLILAASLGSLALQPIAFLQEVGIAFVISLVLDTFVVRPFFFPAMLTLVERRRARRGAAGSPASAGPASAGATGGDLGVP
jgi:RND superfamily putative drug exporter